MSDIKIKSAQGPGRKWMRERQPGAYAKIEKEIEAYKQARLGKINEALFEIIQQVALRVIGKSLTQRDHGELVTKSLEEAKKENVL